MKYFLRLTILLAALFALDFSLPSNASEINKIIDDFSDGPERRWQFYTDQVMGGVSEGGASVQFGSEGPYVRLEGSVSTANNGGFIQIRRNVKEKSISIILTWVKKLKLNISIIGTSIATATNINAGDKRE